MALPAKAIEYFSSINSMANRLSIDLNEAMLINKHQLKSLPYDEQQQLLNDAIITPQVLVKYPLPRHELEQEESPTKYAVKMIVDDHYSYRDEHSAPFSFHTASQRDLFSSVPTVPRRKIVKKVTPKYANNMLQQPKGVPIVKTVISAPAPAQVFEDHNEEVLRAEQIEINMRLDYDIEEDVVDSSGLASLIPKTGLDLLDNW